MNLIDRISRQFEDNMRGALEALELLAAPIAGAVELITASLLDNGKVLVCSGSGSAGDARRFAAQLVSGFELERPALAAMALSADTSTLAPVAAELDPQTLFARQIAAFGHPGDILVTLSTNPRSARVLGA
ncbi:MAG TPA: phosphoheptose isomerase, partial [Thauera sp.]|nr:phosphoheptose isomerase [Thauera sp.]